MARSIPLIRAAAIHPFVKWAAENRRPIEPMLNDVGLPHVWMEEPNLLIPHYAMVDLLDRLQREEGPDIGCRVVKETSLLEIGLIGRAAMTGRSLRDAINRVAAAQPHNTSNAFYSVLPTPGGLVLQHGFNIPMPAQVIHVAESFTAAMIGSLRGFLKLRGRMFDRIDILPHPDHGIAHLAKWFDCEICAATKPPLSVQFTDAALDSPLVRVNAPPPSSPAQDGPRLHDIGMVESTRILVRSMLRSGAPTVERMAHFAGMSVRSYQRRLSDEGQTYSALVEEERQRLLQRSLGNNDILFGEVAAHLGYARQSSLTRAVRRWTGKAPKKLRDQGRTDRPA
ncbi:helix-turn-helix transcriptional regulator [Neotabrizicola shimadae]|uniref:AraC family transcriptional regulator ligand-binding domain-containing protein n=1 Tax=Neotabrizicola shimadae TaxID=2807096 RepID=A0A8G1A011_9RHOB|nr:AraC family transcriptional regulator [Neotabrizicola shimadae]QYZ71664.1 AraC family transcriptional regulator ligand-binding domain-containing protein [Neotabrizicola shimadae]